MQRPVDVKEIPELCKLVTPENSQEVVTYALQTLVPIITNTSFDWELGEIQNLLALISVVEHKDLPYETKRLQAKVIYEVIRQITTEQKAIVLL